MTRVVLVDKTGTLKHLNAKDISDDILYKKCGFKKSEGFERRAAWPVGGTKCIELNPMICAVELWAKDTGRAGTENKYELPPPIDNALYFGTMLLVARDIDGELCDLDIDGWKKLYDVLFGGFDDIDGTESEEDDELDNIPKSKKTKDGYMKDGFVVEDTNNSENESDEDDSHENDSEEDESDVDDSDLDDNDITNNDNGGSELEPEEYYYSEDEE